MIEAQQKADIEQKAIIVTLQQQIDELKKQNGVMQQAIEELKKK